MGGSQIPKPSEEQRGFFHLTLFLVGFSSIVHSRKSYGALGRCECFSPFPCQVSFSAWQDMLGTTSATLKEQIRTRMSGETKTETGCLWGKRVSTRFVFLLLSYAGSYRQCLLPLSAPTLPALPLAPLPSLIVLPNCFSCYESLTIQIHLCERRRGEKFQTYRVSETKTLQPNPIQLKEAVYCFKHAPPYAISM